MTGPCGCIFSWNPELIDSSNERQRIVFMGLYNTLNCIAAEAFAFQSRDVTRHLVDFVSVLNYYVRCPVISI